MRSRFGVGLAASVETPTQPDEGVTRPHSGGWLSASSLQSGHELIEFGLDVCNALELQIQNAAIPAGERFHLGKPMGEIVHSPPQLRKDSTR
jgi:hypothetical protein